MDQHQTAGATPEDLARAHAADLAVQERFGVDFLNYWQDYKAGMTYCLVNAPSPEAVRLAHDAAHGKLPGSIVPVDESEVVAFLGRSAGGTWPPHDQPATRTIVFTDIVGSTSLFEQLGDSRAVDLLRRHNSLVGDLLLQHGGRKVKHTGDGFMLAFDSPSRALEFSLRLQDELTKGGLEQPISVKIGMTAGEPVDDEGDLFGTAVNLARRLCEAAESGRVYVSDVIRGLTMGKDFTFTPVGELVLKGFSSPVAAYQAGAASPRE